jgi:hypothetical protein
VIFCAACRVAPPPRPAPVATPTVTPPPDPPQPEPPPPFEWRHTFVAAPAAGTFAVVDESTTLHKRPRADDRGVPFRGWHPSVVKVVGREAGFVAVDLDWPDDPTVYHCAQAPLGPVALRMYIREEELADVTTTSVVMATGEDTGILAAPGVRVRKYRDLWSLYARTGEQSYYGGMSSDRLYIDAPAAPPDVGKFYAPVLAASLRAELASTAPFTGSLDLYRVWRLDYGVENIDLPRQLYAQSSADPHHVVAGAPCLQVAGHVDSTSPSRGVGGGGCAGPPRPWDERWRVAAGADLVWRTGGPAGALLRDIELADPPRRRGDRRCFAPPFGCGRTDDLTVCAPARTITHIPASDPPAGLSMIVPRRAAKNRKPPRR